MKNNSYDIYNRAYKISEYFEDNISMCLPSNKKYIRNSFENEIYLLLKNIYRAYFNKKMAYHLLIECLVNIAILDSLITSMRKCIKDKTIINKINNLSYLTGDVKNSIFSWKSRYETNIRS